MRNGGSCRSSITRHGRLAQLAEGLAVVLWGELTKLSREIFEAPSPVARERVTTSPGRRGRIRSRAGARPPLVVWEVRKSGSWIGLGKAELYHMLWFWGRSDLPVGSFCQKLFLLDAGVAPFLGMGGE